MTKETRGIKSRWRRDCTTVTTERRGKDTVKVRRRKPDAPSMKVWARETDEEGHAWLERKKQA